MLFKENAELEARNIRMQERVEDLERTIKRLWQRGGAAAPSPRELKAIATEAQAHATRERRDAEGARQHARSTLRDAIQARSDAFEAINRLHVANETLESDKVSTREWAAMDVTELSRKMAQLSDQLSQERERVALLTADVERSEAARSADVGRLLAEIQALRVANAEWSRQQRSEAAQLTAALSAAREETSGLAAEGEHRQAMLREQVARQESLVMLSVENSASSAMVMSHQVNTLAEELKVCRSENGRLKRELDEARDNYSRLGAQARDADGRTQTETTRLNSVIERLGGEAAESRSTMLNRIEQLTQEREHTVAELSTKLEAVSDDRDHTAAELRQTVDKLRWLQSKALQSGSVRPGRYRQMIYWESMKNSHAEESSASWRSDAEDSELSRNIALEHRLDTSFQRMTSRAR